MRVATKIIKVNSANAPVSPMALKNYIIYRKDNIRDGKICGGVASVQLYTETSSLTLMSSTLHFELC